MTRALLRAARPRQWTKNLLVVAAPAAGGALDEWPIVWRTFVALVAFCVASSGTYYWNDIHDIDADRRHPKKRNRAIASGAVPLGVAKAVGTLLLVAGIGLGFAVNWQLGVVTLGYVALTTAYSNALKHVAVVDLVVVAAGFVLRAIAGSVATGIEMSTWFLLCTSFGSLFIVTGKRYAELREYGDHAGAHRASLDDYTLGFLRIVLSVSVGATLVSYCMWAFDTKEVSGSTWPFYELSIVPMVTALLRYTLILEQGHGAAPEEIFLSDRTLQVLGLLWASIFGLGVYVG